MRKKNIRMVAVIALILAMTLNACGSSGSTEYAAKSSEVAAVDSVSMASAGSGDLYDEYAEENYDSDGGQMEEVQDSSRKLITNMWITAESDNLPALLSEVELQVAALGGYISDSDVNNDSYYDSVTDRYVTSPTPSYATLTIRIPADKLDDFVTEVTENSNITSQSKSVEDVTLTYVDLESHKAALQAEEDRLLELLEMAETVEDMITIEDKLADVRYRLESMESQLRSYDNQITYSTVHLTLNQVEKYTPAEPTNLWERIRDGFTSNLRAVGEWLLDVFVALVTHLPGLVVFVLFCWLIIVIVRKLRKRNNERKLREMENGVSYGKRKLQGRVRNTAGETERREEHIDESADRNEDRDHIEQTSDDQK